jgi:hypothetical protein
MTTFTELGADQPFMSKPRAVTTFKREFDELTAELTDRVKVEKDRSADCRAELHCAPQRLVVQLGEVGLSVSWVAARSGDLSEGRLLVIEWEGAIAHGGGIRGTRTAKPKRERVFRAEATGPEDWCWREEAKDGRAYSSRKLAGQCFVSAAHALE